MNVKRGTGTRGSFEIGPALRITAPRLFLFIKSQCKTENIFKKTTPTKTIFLMTSHILYYFHIID